MASGLPVAGLLAEGVCDLVNDGRTGYLLDVEGLSEEQEVAGYREQLTDLIENKSMRVVMGQSAYLEVQQRSWHEALSSSFEPCLNAQKHALLSILLWPDNVLSRGEGSTPQRQGNSLPL